MCYHVSYSFEPCLSTEEGSGAATCLTALDIVSLLKRVPMLTRVLQLWTPTSPRRRVLVPPRVPRLRNRLPAEEGTGASTCFTTL
jgi:hypothetical protein